MSIPTDLIAEAGMVGAEQDAMMQQMQEQMAQSEMARNVAPAVQAVSNAEQQQQ